MINGIGNLRVKTVDLEHYNPQFGYFVIGKTLYRGNGKTTKDSMWLTNIKPIKKVSFQTYNNSKLSKEVKKLYKRYCIIVYKSTKEKRLIRV